MYRIGLEFLDRVLIGGTIGKLARSISPIFSISWQLEGCLIFLIGFVGDGK